MIVGPTGAGKSVLLALMALQFRRYRNSQVFVFDFGGSIRAATLAMGGDWQDLGGSLTDDAEPTSVQLQPLALIHHVPERAWAADWIVDILLREGTRRSFSAHLASCVPRPYQNQHKGIFTHGNDRFAAYRGFSRARLAGAERPRDSQSEHPGL
jgi:type IV secretion system protein VirB4